MYLAQATKNPAVEKEYELYKTKDVEDVGGKKVTIKEAVGRFRIDQLLEEKKRIDSVYASEKADIEEKISSIEALG